MSQEKLGEALGITFQQVQKYERGTNRISASRLFDMARVLDVPVSFFYDELPAELNSGVVSTGQPVPEAGSDPFARRETLELVRSYYRVPNPNVRKWLRELIGAFADNAMGEIPPGASPRPRD